MNIQQIQPVTFNSRRKFVSQCMAEDMELLMKKMRSDSKFTEQGDIWKSSSVRGVLVNNEGSIKDGKFLAKRNKNNELIPYGEDVSMIETDKYRLLINNQTGEVIEYKKSFFKTWKSLLNEASWLVIGALNLYHNDKIVQKVVVNKEGLTKSGQEKAEKELKPLLDFINTMIGKVNK